MEIDEKIKKIADLVISGKHLETESLTKELIEMGVEPKLILDKGLMEGMAVVGQRFRDQQMFVPQVLVAARAMKFSMKVLDPLMVGEQNKSKGKILIGTVKGDVHDIGKNLVGIMLQGAGYEVIDVGTGISAETYLEEYKKNKADLIGLSALLTTTMLYMRDVIEYFKKEKINVPIIVGGAPLNKKFADEIGADGFGRSAYEAVHLVDSILHKN
jgi:5-methyltetrahydrofolate--homocysteine methyltransferase